uniref:Wall-associated receptor kinase 3 n=1 Tax=Aegilops tauschii TaxID=37682 RepID=M8CFZ7_AEGTA
MAMPAAALTVLLLQLCFSATAVAQVTGAAPGCPTICAGVSVPYPFGVREGCYLPGFNLTCDRALGRERLLIGGAGGTLEVAEISLANSMVRVMDTAGAVKLTGSGNGTGLARLASSGQWGGLRAAPFAGPFVVSGTRNRLVVTGCNQQATLLGEGGNVIVGCSAFCPVTDTFLSTISPEEVAACAGVGCCETPIPIGRPSYSVQLAGLDLNQEMDLQLPIAVRIAETGWVEGNSAGLLNKSLQDSSSTTAISVVLEWAVESKRLLQPQDTATGCPQEAAALATCAIARRATRATHTSPAPADAKTSTSLGVGIGIGCGAGLLLLVLGVFFLSRTLNQQRAKVLKKKFFRQNRGHLLQQLVSQKADIAERMIIPLVELEKATNNFDKAREIGGGGHGTVYKGIMSDLHVVAIKKSKVVVQREIDEFINEVAILSQINHRHVVKLFGCCLETEVPLLVYEFISNGTLYHHLHVEEPEASLPWVERLRIATETARAFAYLHSAVSIPIVHRDIKSQNILLDGTLIAKVSDFGASRCIPIDETGDATAIQGTFGYLDPMYYYSGQLTEKSDVYSFGVLLMELLTRKKPCSYRSSEEKSLVAYFTALLATGDLASLLDPQVAQEGGKMVEEVALLAAACVRMEGGQRPTMRQVEMALENLRVPHENVVMSDMDAPSYAMIEGGRMEEEIVRLVYSKEDKQE